MWKQFCNKHSDTKICSLSKFKKVFYTDFNLGFGNPHTDTCSTCKKFKVSIKNTKDIAEKGDLRTQYRLHKLRAKKFYDTMKTESADTIKIVFDMQQNQPLPKLSVGEVFFSRQVWLYNLTIMIHKRKQEKKYIFHYVWLETESGRGANEVASCVRHFLDHMEENFENLLGFKPEKKLKLVLFSDACASQNKNVIVMGALMNFIERSKIFSTMQHIFPIRGHSYMPADRVFGRIEKEYRKHEEMISPKDYCDILEKTGNLMRYGKDWTVRELKTQAKKMFKSKLPFKISEAKVIQYQRVRDKVKISVSTTYSGSMTECEVLKKTIRNSRLMEIAQILPKRNMVNVKKRDNVKSLLECVEIPEHAKQFYEEVLAAENSGNDDEENINKEYDERENIF
ncbi:hypothetical protein RI129_003272 [Pyrocoelia pectoralis]|uniref:DUF7869 domain-containing protein n=1 Tax=Pyrocoelia pectoralis TaxID=417401 RepID=A0AAN7ZIH8_9COLE